ncbi:MAG: A/G-specific adenine glycosylase [Alphaproteobacteria bacterium]|nr:A/G-specific adenine glycosylase [Alphaproteobacteria bacterium]
MLESTDLSSRLLAWYGRHHRVLPWRAPPGGSQGRTDPYHVWLSEIMLQQTTVAVVKDYFHKFSRTWPDVHALAGADLDDVLRAWAGLGYYARARNLHKCAGIVSSEHSGQFPRSAPELQKLPGIGPYTAAAIAAIAFDEPCAAVDGNVERVLARYYAIETPLPDAKPEVKDKAEALVPPQRAGDFAQALMDLGATICAPRKANCLICPWSQGCQGRILGLAETLPRKAPKKAKPTRFGTCFWLERSDGAVLLRRRPERGLLGGMMEVPSTNWAETRPQNPATEAPVEARWRHLKERVNHTFTHFHLELEIWSAEAPPVGTTLPEGDFRWVAKHELATEALPSVMRKVCAAVLD